MFKTLIFILGMAFEVAVFAVCHPPVASNTPQYLIGYGSLIQTASKESTYANTGKSIPVIVKGYQRGWSMRGTRVGFSTTFLGIVKKPRAKFNGVIFSLPNEAAIAAYDSRELFYCRQAVPRGNIKSMVNESIPEGQFWIYVNRPEDTAKPSQRYPLVQSYVDIFLSGCLEIEKEYGISNFAEECINTTTDWSSHWVNDRIFPRRPWQYQPDAIKIDHLLVQKMPVVFHQIKIE